MMANVTTTLGLTKDPAKYEQRALAYEKKGNVAKAQKNRDKASRLRANQASGQPQQHYSNPLKNPERYDQKALKWQNKGNQVKAQKNRDKAARLRAEQAQRNMGMGTAIPMGGSSMQMGGSPMQMGTAMPMNMPAATATMVSAPTVETHVRPTVIEQTARPERILEVQPVVHRDIDQPQVHIVERHSFESVPSTGPAVINRPAVIQETIHPRVIEEVQPVIHRQVPAPFIERVEQHTSEHLTQPTTVVKEVMNVPAQQQQPGMAAGGLPTGSNNAGLNQQQQARRL